MDQQVAGVLAICQRCSSVRFTASRSEHLVCARTRVSSARDLAGGWFASSHLPIHLHQTQPKELVQKLMTASSQKYEETVLYLQSPDQNFFTGGQLDRRKPQQFLKHGQLQGEGCLRDHHQSSPRCRSACCKRISVPALCGCVVPEHEARTKPPSGSRPPGEYDVAFVTPGPGESIDSIRPSELARPTVLRPACRDSSSRIISAAAEL
jgi:hypothetical protein